MNNQDEEQRNQELINSQTLLEKAGLEKKMTIADLGCGRRGYFTLQAAKLVGNEGLIYAVDVVKSALENVENAARTFNFANIKTIWADLEVPGATKIPDASVDLAILNNVLFQTEKRKSVIQEALRILKRHGRLLITDWKKDKTLFGPPRQNRIESKQIIEYAQQIGLNLVNEIDAGLYHYALILEKK